jgi:8-oxo-dGTP pyrophosphatase MutT (NUDIX family)
MSEPVKAAGVIAKSSSGRVLMCKRTDGEGWAFPGGRLKAGETAEQAAMREFFEETGYRLGRITTLMRRVKDGVDFSTFLCHCDDEFPVRLNHEHSAYGWFNPVELLNGDAEPDDLEPEAARAITDSLDRLDARLAAIGG